MINLIQHIANKEVEVVGPVFQGATIFEHRKIKLDPDLHGWYVLRIGNEVEIVREASLREIRDVKMKTFMGLCLGESVVPVNFENFSRVGLASSEDVVYFGRISRDWSVIRVALSEDQRLIFVREEESVKIKRLLRQLKAVFDTEETLGSISGITPEMRFLFFNHTFLREQQREAERLAQQQLEREQYEDAIRELNRTVEGRVRFALAQSGARLVSTSRLSQREGGHLQVVWEITGDNGRTERISSVVRGDTLAIVPSGLGFCASGGDTTQTLASAPVLAKAYIKEAGSVYITRNQGLGSFARHGHDDDDW